jgi:hypothetical protein
MTLYSILAKLILSPLGTGILAGIEQQALNLICSFISSDIIFSLLIGLTVSRRQGLGMILMLIF